MARKKSNPNQLDLFKDSVESLGQEFDRVSESIADAIFNKIKKAIDATDDSSKQFLQRFKRNIKAIADSSGALLDIEQKLEAGSARTNDFQRAELKLLKQKSVIKQALKKAQSEQINLSETLVKAANEELAVLNAEKDSLGDLKTIFEDTNKESTFFSTLLSGAGKALNNLGIDNPFSTIKDNMSSINQELVFLEYQLDTNKELSEEDVELYNQRIQALKGQRGLFNQFVIALQSSLTPANVLQGLITGTVASMGAINAEQVKFQKLTGEGVKNLSSIRLEASTLVDVLVQATSAAEQFGFNIQDTISAQNIAAASDLVEGLGLSAEEANKLLLLTEAQGLNLMDVASAANDVLDPSISTKAVFQDIVASSAQTKVLFAFNAEAMAKTASDARLLGLNLSNIEKISKSILDIESSIAAEFEAEVLTGQQLELSRARMFALQGDLQGVTEELAKNQKLFNDFSGMNVLQQESIANALGLGVDELSESILLQKELSKLSETERKRKRIDEKIALTARENITKSIQSITQQIAILIEPLVRGFEGALKFTNLLIDGVKELKTPLIALGTYYGIVALRAQAAAISTMITTFSLAKFNPLFIGLGIAGALAAAGAVRQANQRGVVPLAEGGVVTSPTFALIGEAGPEAVIPLDRGGRNSMLSSADINAIAKAVREGASQAQINLDGGRVSNRLQPSLAVNTRKYSI